MKYKLKAACALILFIALLVSCAQQMPPQPEPTSTATSLQAQASSAPPAESLAEESPVWPQQAMGDLPDPGGTVLSVAQEDGRVHVVLEGIDGEAAVEYIQILWDRGYTAQAEGEDENGGMMCSATKGGDTVVLLYDPEGSTTTENGLFQITKEDT